MKISSGVLWVELGGTMCLRYVFEAWRITDVLTFERKKLFRWISELCLPFSNSKIATAICFYIFRHTQQAVLFEVRHAMQEYANLTRTVPTQSWLQLLPLSQTLCLTGKLVRSALNKDGSVRRISAIQLDLSITLTEHIRFFKNGSLTPCCLDSEWCHSKWWYTAVNDSKWCHYPT